MAYLGTYRQESDLLSIDLTVTQHRHVPGVVSVGGELAAAIEKSGL